MNKRGFTLLEVVIALTIVGTLLAIAFGGLRVALSAWRKGEDRAEAHQHARTLQTMLARSIGAAYPYRIAAEESPESLVQFEGSPDRLSFVTLAAPVPLPAPIAVTTLEFRYLRPDGGWEDRWDGASEAGLPAAVQVSLGTTLEGHSAVPPRITVSLRTVKPPS